MERPKTARLAGETDAVHNSLLELPNVQESIQKQNVSSSSDGDRLISLLDAQRLDETVIVPVCYLAGAAGTGKTFLMKGLIAANPKFGLLCSTTGISAVNLGAVTINSAFKYFDTASLEDAYVRGRLTHLMHLAAERYENLIIDEISMMDGKQLDIFYRAAAEVNGYEGMRTKGKKFGIIITGDFMQLPPVKADWAFNAECWSLFQERTLRLTKIWRQGDARFLEALNFLRAGKGNEAAEILRTRVNWISSTISDFDGTTILAKNDAVDRHNWLALNNLPGPVIKIRSKRAGKQLSEWTKNIPDELHIKIGAYVMILTNAEMLGLSFGETLDYANGDVGHVIGVNQEVRQVGVKLLRDGSEVGIGQISRDNGVKDEPGEIDFYGFKPYYDSKWKKWVVGTILYEPLRLAYASTVHKVQGLTIGGKIQVDSRAHFFGAPAMAYTAISRARRPEDVYIIGTPEGFAKRVKAAEEVLPWL